MNYIIIAIIIIVLAICLYLYTTKEGFDPLKRAGIFVSSEPWEPTYADINAEGDVESRLVKAQITKIINTYNINIPPDHIENLQKYIIDTLGTTNLDNDTVHSTINKYISQKINGNTKESFYSGYEEYESDYDALIKANPGLSSNILTPDQQKSLLESVESHYYKSDDTGYKLKPAFDWNEIIAKNNISQTVFDSTYIAGEQNEKAMSGIRCFEAANPNYSAPQIGYAGLTATLPPVSDKSFQINEYLNPEYGNTYGTKYIN